MPDPSPNTGNARFNAEAAEWDSNPFVKAMSLEAWKAIQRHRPHLFANPSGKKPDVLEIGCGTGLLSFEVAPAVNRLVAVDAAEGMIEVLAHKLQQQPDAPKNITPLAILLEDAEDERLPPADQDLESSDGDTARDGGGQPRLKYDLITSHLVLHHIAELRPVLVTMLDCLKKGGMVALTDFEDFGPEARKFHPEAKMEGVEHHGIGRQWIADLMREVGFANVKVEVAWEHEKMVERHPGEFEGGKPGPGQGEIMKFSYILCTGERA